MAITKTDKILYSLFKNAIAPWYMWFEMAHMVSSPLSLDIIFEIFNAANKSAHIPAIMPINIDLTPSPYTPKDI